MPRKSKNKEKEEKGVKGRTRQKKESMTRNKQGMRKREKEVG